MATQDTPAAGGGIQMVETSRRLGRFSISDNLLRESINNGLAARLFYGSVPLDVTRSWIERTTEFLLWHPKFDSCGEGSLIPQYMAQVENGAITWVRIDKDSEAITTETFQEMMRKAVAE